MEIFATRKMNKADAMRKSNTNEYDSYMHQKSDFDIESFKADDDVLMEHILENIHFTPIGRVLKRISSLPEVRKRKVVNLRQQICNGEYQLNERLDNALEKVLDDLNI